MPRSAIKTRKARPSPPESPESSELASPRTPRKPHAPSPSTTNIPLVPPALRRTGPPRHPLRPPRRRAITTTTSAPTATPYTPAVQSHESVGLPRGDAHAIFYTLGYLAHLERSASASSTAARRSASKPPRPCSCRCWNRSACRYPRSRVINHPSQAVAAARGLRFPVVVKPNVGGSGAGIVRYDSPDATRSRRREGRIDLGLDHTAPRAGVHPRPRRPHHPRRDARRQISLRHQSLHVRRNLRSLPRRHLPDQRRRRDRNRLRRRRRQKRPESRRLSSRRRKSSTPSSASSAKRSIDVGGIEYIIDDRDGRLYYYDINALSNFVPTPRTWSASIRSRGWSIISIEEARLMRIATATGCPSSAAGCATSKTRTWRRPGTTSAPRPPQRRDRLRPHARRRTESQRHQGRGGALPRRLVHGRGARRRHRTAGNDGRRAADVPQPGAARQAGRQHRPHQRRPALAQCRLVVVGGRGEEIRRATSNSMTTATPAPPNGWMSWTASGSAIISRMRANITRSRTPCCSRSRSRSRGRRFMPAANRKRPKNLIAAEVRRLRDARRPARRVGEKIADMRRAPRAQGPAAACNSASRRYTIVRETEAEAENGTSPHHRRESERRRLPELSAMVGRDAARTARVAGRIFRVQSRPALRPGRHAATDCRPHRRVRSSRRGLAAPPIQPASAKRWIASPKLSIRRGSPAPTHAASELASLSNV